MHIKTPGRLLDHLENRNLASKFGNLRCLVLDEADRLLDQGFRQDLEKIARFLPRDSHPR
jgi:ATP-dependent RNA helicase MSS116, mitochondrial